VDAFIDLGHFLHTMLTVLVSQLPPRVLVKYCERHFFYTVGRPANRLRSSVTFRQACNGRNFSEAMDEEPGLVKRQP
jgi:hypothetical protein